MPSHRAQVHAKNWRELPRPSMSVRNSRIKTQARCGGWRCAASPAKKTRCQTCVPRSRRTLHQQWPMPDESRELRHFPRASDSREAAIFRRARRIVGRKLKWNQSSESRPKRSARAGPASRAQDRPRIHEPVVWVIVIPPAINTRGNRRSHVKPGSVGGGGGGGGGGARGAVTFARDNRTNGFASVRGDHVSAGDANLVLVFDPISVASHDRGSAPIHQVRDRRACGGAELVGFTRKATVQVITCG